MISLREVNLKRKNKLDEIKWVTYDIRTFGKYV